MLMSRTNQRHSIKWQPRAAMYGSVCALDLTSTLNMFGGETSIDRGNLKI
jgi:hypothetical protein